MERRPRRKVTHAVKTHQALLNSGFKTISAEEAREAGLSICGGRKRKAPKEIDRDDWLLQVRETASSGKNERSARILALNATPPDRIFDQPSKKDLDARFWEGPLGDIR